MRIKQPLRRVLAWTQPTWDRPDFRPEVRKSFRNVLLCGTPMMGGDRYASSTEEKIVYYTCKSRSCPRCGRRNTLIWQIEQSTALPEMPYIGVVFTMPDVLWPTFRQNRHLLNDLDVLGADVIQNWIKTKCGAKAMVIVVRHTFGRHLNFNPHLHILVSSQGWNESKAGWVPLDLPAAALMPMWRYAVITYLRGALDAGALNSEMGSVPMRKLLKAQYERWWSVDVDQFASKEHFLRYAGRYAKRPPVAQYRFFKLKKTEIGFWTHDHKLNRTVATTHTPEKFVRLLADHVPARYKHAIRYFGLLSPRSKARRSAALFAMLGQNKPPRPARVSWSELSIQTFGVDPLIDSNGQRMEWTSRVARSRDKAA